MDSVFGFRPEYNEFWDFRIWIDVDPKSLADVIVDNSDFTFPRLTWRSHDRR